jgi:hypothetical protein
VELELRAELLAEFVPVKGDAREHVVELVIQGVASQMTLEKNT